MVTSWGNYPKYKDERQRFVVSSDQADLFKELPVLPYGTGRSYGDSCLNDQGVVLNTHYYNHFIAFDSETGVLRCESGVTLEAILQCAIPRGWMLPVMPGTQFISVGGAIANDVHGKNHHLRGTFASCLIQFELLRSNQERLLCSNTSDSGLFAATIGGLGLTGLITWVDIQLVPLESEFIATTVTPFSCLAEFMEINQQAEKSHEFTSSWLDCQSKGKHFGRGIFFAANYSKEQQPPQKKKKPLIIPFNCPNIMLNSLSIKCFNELYYRTNARKKAAHQIQHFTQHLFPLDNVLHWNRIYGKRGFVQYQCMIPFENGLENLTDLLQKITQSGMGSFLSVLKTFGDKPSPGLLSFPRPGITLALDFPFMGEKTLSLLQSLDQKVMGAGGRVYPAKDARMSAEAFKQYFPQVERFINYKDPNFSSSFWRRVMEQL
jgi:FAD/FMN-containing dehydrogenase